MNRPRTSPPASTRQRAPMPIVLAPLAGLLVLALLACAPQSRPAGGEIGDAVEASLASGSASFDHSDWSALLASGVRDGLVDYGFFQQHRAELDAYLERIAGADLASLDPDHLRALLINAYNAYTIEAILDHPGIDSIRDIDGVWSDAEHTVGGFELTLDTIEHGLLRPYFEDPRVHFAVNCASMSCAPLPPWAFEGDRIDEQLEQWTRHVLGWDKYLRVEDGQLWVTRLLDWYGSDFTDPDANPRADTLAGFLARYAPDSVRAFIDEHDGDPPIAFLEYDWSLNRAGS